MAPWILDVSFSHAFDHADFPFDQDALVIWVVLKILSIEYWHCHTPRVIKLLNRLINAIEEFAGICPIYELMTESTR